METEVAIRRVNPECSAQVKQRLRHFAHRGAMDIESVGDALVVLLVDNGYATTPADLYELGFRGEAGGLRTAFGEILGKSFDPNALVDGLGERFEIMRGYFKPYSGCRYTHAAIDAVLALQEEEEVEEQFSE